MARAPRWRLPKRPAASQQQRSPRTATQHLLGAPRLLAPALVALLFVTMALGGGCASGPRPYTLTPPKTFDDDTTAIPKPEQAEASELWDYVYYTSVYQAEKPLDLGWTGRQVGQAVGLASGRQADNVNVLDEPPNSSWYARRHFYKEMTPAQLARGPNPPGGAPQVKEGLVVTGGKAEGATPGFTVRDAKGDRYLLKLDDPDYPELGSSSEVISTKILYAAGYHVPENYVVYFDPERLRVAEKATLDTGGEERSMTKEDVLHLLSKQPRGDEGRVRAMASKFIEGEPIGPWSFEGTREDDPNDRVWHQHRRELRGLRVVGSWINDADRRAANTLAVYTGTKEKSGYLKHYLIDMGGTLGSTAGSPKSTLHGYEHLVDPGEIGKSALSLGLHSGRSYLFARRDTAIQYPSVGYFEAKLFDPGDWEMVYPNPAHERMTLRDAFWGAKIVMSFSDEDLEAIVGSARMTNPAAEDELLRVLKERRDKIGRYWFARAGALGRFRIESEAAAERPVVRRATTPASGASATAQAAGSAASPARLRFDDLAVTGELEPAASSSYAYTFFHGGERISETRVAQETRIPLALPGGPSLRAYLSGVGTEAPEARVVRARVHARRAGDPAAGRAVDVYVHVPEGEAPPRVVGLRRSE